MTHKILSILIIIASFTLSVNAVENEAPKTKTDQAKAPAETAKEKSAATNKPPVNAVANDKNTATNKAPVSVPGMLTTEEENKLTSFISDEANGIDYRLTVTCLNGVSTDKEKAKYKNSKKLLYKIQCRMESQNMKSKTGGKGQITDGSVIMYVRDSKGNIISNKSVALKTMIPEASGDGGYIGEIEKQGLYTIIITYRYKNLMFGKKIPINIVPAKN